MRVLVVIVIFAFFCHALEQKALKSDDFVESLGTNVHISYGGNIVCDSTKIQGVHTTIILNSSKLP